MTPLLEREKIEIDVIAYRNFRQAEIDVALKEESELESKISKADADIVAWSTRLEYVKAKRRALEDLPLP